MIFIGAEHILSPLGDGAAENFEKASAGQSGVTSTFGNKKNIEKPASLIQNYKNLEGYSKIESMCISSVQNSFSGINIDSTKEKWVFILSTTKGDIDYLSFGEIEKAKPTYLARRIADQLPVKADFMVVSNACTSGLSATILAHDLISSGEYTHAIVVGADVISSFTFSGFESFYALSESLCSPYDKDRNGLNLGEAASSVILSSVKEIFINEPILFCGGSTANDANHISGPSRDGEGLVRAINSVMTSSSVMSSDIDFISAHGTGTVFNDDMESIAFTRCNLDVAPVNSMKGYFGHTLGAAGVLEISMSLQSMRNGFMLKTLGCSNPRTTNKINVLLKNERAELNTVLKTASGFGGINSAVLLKRS